MGANVEIHNQTRGSQENLYRRGRKKSARARGVKDTMRTLPTELAKQGS